ncbi:vWA domain-containing protein [Flammeovirga agarivorans]|uniref:VWA domain-containing protein n=1 Tax=Flammeovirga agarivorans TaxID=2726742 RepID=A0A7X8XU69_9BACT|nr:vWA domain-containing protein [Flammeovirga agarivorans]NLR90063.1 VWA domain-containing protein [Flammeovirga agarivorans]
MNGLYIEYSWWWLFFGALACALITYFFYTQKQIWNLTVNRILIVLRFSALVLILFLLLDPMFKSIQRYYEKPIMSFIIDDSESMIATVSKDKLQSLVNSIVDVAKKLESDGYDTKFYNLSGDKIEEEDLASLNFDGKVTNLSKSIQKLEEINEHENLAGITLVTDGIFNQGFSPLYVPSVVPVYTVGIGDTIPQIDLQVKDVYANRIAYMGNKFPIIAEVVNEGFLGKVVEVSLTSNGKILDRKRFKISNEKGFEQIEFLVEAKKKGYQKFIVSVKSLDGEFSKENNSKSVYIEVIEGKEKILLIANAPHPDIKAIREGVEKNKNYELHVYIPGLKLNNGLGYDKKAKYDLVILHEFPNIKNKAGLLIKKFVNEQVPFWYIIGDVTDINAFNKMNNLLTIEGYRGQKDKVTVAFNDTFKAFTFPKEKKDLITKMAPVEVPFGEYKLKSGNILMYHQIGSVKTSKPLLVLGETGDVKSAVLTGTGLWKWRLQEGLLDSDEGAIDELISKVIQYLSTKTDKRRFRVNTTQPEYSDIEDIVIETEVYNDIYESIYGQTIDLVIQNDKGEKMSYTYLNSAPYFKYHLSDLTEGVYKYTASTNINGKKEYSTGNFTVKTMELEALNPTANFELLRSIADKTGGAFYESNTINEISDLVLSNKSAQRIHAEEMYKEVGSSYWILTLLCLLLFSEWVIRKVFGGF